MTQLTQTTLTSRQLEILLLLYRFRFLTRSHIQTLLHHKNHAHILKWLNELTSQNYITQYYTKTIPASPAIYSLAKLGRTYLKAHTDSNTKHLSRLRRDPVYTSKFRNHYLFLADIYISLLELTNKT
ncbi:MAG TPA: replication-relaxation family protein, partial [Patescibacteria group bacterium]